ncbi:MAG TPA: ArsR family transcriptional regulator [bacterium]|nr:ArsR family transcriptional regulator [bacterium]HEX68254.1 ArsR family transcriptional regulator [bacterium]
MLMDKLVKEAEKLKRHLGILKLVVEKGPLGIFRISDITGLPPHKVRYSLRILERAGLLRPTSRGARATPAGEEELKNTRKELKEVIKSIEKLLR